MKRWMMWTALLTLFALPASALAQNPMFGIGVNYWRAIDDVRVNDIDRDGLGYVVSLSERQELFGVVLEVEHAPDGRGVSPKSVTSPELLVTVGGLLWAGVGIGIDYTDGSFASKPFYDFRAGVRIELLPLPIEGFVNYRFNDWQDSSLFRDIDSDTLIIGLRLHFPL